MKTGKKQGGIFAEQTSPSNIVEVSNTPYLRVHFHFTNRWFEPDKNSYQITNKSYEKQGYFCRVLERSDTSPKL